MADVLARIVKIVEQQLEVAVDPDEPFGRLPIDSIMMAEMMMFIESEFKIRADERMLDVGSLRELAHYIERASQPPEP